MSAPRINRVVADFKAATTRDKTVHLKELRGQNVVMYFYPKDNTSGCTTEGQDFAERHAKFRRLKTVVFGVSRDSITSHEKFRDKYKFPFDLISDPEEKLCKKFDVIREKTLYGRKFLGIERSTFLIDANGKLRKAWRKLKVNGHAAEVLEAVKALTHGNAAQPK